MQFRVTAVLVALFAVLAAGVAYFDLTAPAPSGTPTVAPSIVVDIPAADVTYVEVSEAGKTAAVARRDESSWEIVAPTTEPADGRRVEDAVGRIAQLTAARKIDAPGDLGAYGLTTPAIRIELRARDGATRELLVGNKTPDNSAYYAKPGTDPTVYLISSFSISEPLRWLAEPPRPRPTPTSLPPLPVPTTAPDVVGTSTPAR